MKKKHLTNGHRPTNGELAQSLAKEPPIKIAICLPWQNQVEADFCRSLVKMYGMITGQYVMPGYADVNLFDINGTYIAWSRTDLTKAALEWGATHLLWLDSDMTFPDWTFHQLFKQDKDIIGANYARRRAPHGPVTFKTINAEPPHTLCYTEQDSTGLEEVDAIGFGVVLVKASVFAKMKTVPFRVTDDEQGSKRVGEDVYFCQMAKAAGIPIYVDHDLSHHVGHVGAMEYHTGHSLVSRKFADPTIVIPKLELVRP